MALACLLAIPALSQAQVDTSDWTCELCPFENGHDAEFEAGALYVSDDAARFGNATGLDEEGGYAALGGHGSYADGGLQINWRAEDLALDARELEIELGRQGSYGVYVGYNEIPYRQFDTTATIFNVARNDYLALPPGWVAAGTTVGFTELNNSLVPRNIGHDRDILTAGGHFLMSRGFRFYADYRRDSKEGMQILSGSSFTQSSMLPRVIDYQTDIIDLGVRYKNGPLSLTLAWYGSFFDNGAASLTWENPFFDDPATPGFEPFRQALEPGNEFQQVSLTGSYRFDALDAIIGFAVASGSGKRDAVNVGYTSNPALNPLPLPAGNLDGKLDTNNYSLSFSARPFAKARLNLGWQFDERDNRTPRDSWSRVIADTFPSFDPELNTPYSFERNRLTASADYELFDQLRLSAGYRRTVLDRDFQEVAEQTEDGSWGRARWRPSGWFDISVKGGVARRDIDRYNENTAIALGQNPLLRKYNLAYRYRQYAEVLASVAPADWPVSATISALYADDSFTRSQLGMTGARNTHVSLDLSWLVSESSSVYFIVGGEEIDADQAGSEAFAAPDWTAQHSDSFSHYGGGIELRQLGEQTRLILDYTHTTGETGILIDRIGASPSRLPDIDTDFDSLRMTLRYQQSEKLDIDLNLRYEAFESNDWALNGVEADTIPTVLTLGADPYDYDVWALSVSFRYLIGGRDISFPE